MPSKLDAALAWAARGFRVFPLPPNGTRPSAEWKGWPEWATTDPAQIRAWWKGTDQNIGFCTTGWLVVDIDTKKGRDGMRSWMELHGGFDTLTIRTKSGGYHLYYSGADVALNQGALGDGLDIRSHNGYVVAPGSVVDGGTYDVLIDDPVAPAPQHIVARCKPPGQRAENAQVALVDLDTPAAVQAAVDRVARAQGAVQGEQSERAYKLAAAVRDHGISEAMCNAIMQEWAARCSPPILPHDLAGRVANAYAYAQNAPGTKHPEVMFGAIHIEPPPPPPPVIPMQLTFGNALPLSILPPRPHVLRGIMVRGEVTALLAAGGVGKSLLGLVAAVHLALGRPFLGHENCVGPAKSVIYNAEDSLAEMSMRLHAICTVMQVPFEQVQPFIRLISGKRDRQANVQGVRLRLVTGGQNPERNDEAVRSLIEIARDPDVAMVSLDPLNKLHTCNGSDNIAMTFVMDVLEFVAEEADVALLISHHISKPSTGRRTAGNADASQGAAAVVNGARTVLTLAAPEDEDAARYALRPQERHLLIRLDGAKNNRGLLGPDPVWLRKVGVKLWNGEDVGALEEVLDMRDRRDDLHKLIARMAAATIHASQKGEMSIGDLASAIIPHDSVLTEMGVERVKDTLKQMNGKSINVLVDRDTRTAAFCVFQAGNSYKAKIA